MREIKFRLVVINTKASTLKFVIYTLDEIERGLPILGENKIYGLPRDLYTGRKDKKENEIYEGDIVKVTYDDFLDGPTETLHVAQWCKDEQAIRYYPPNLLKKDKDWCCHIGGMGKKNEKHEIIGNIYENKELLKGSDEHAE